MYEGGGFVDGEGNSVNEDILVFPEEGYGLV